MLGKRRHSCMISCPTDRRCCAVVLQGVPDAGVQQPEAGGALPKVWPPHLHCFHGEFQEHDLTLFASKQPDLQPFTALYWCIGAWCVGLLVGTLPRIVPSLSTSKTGNLCWKVGLNSTVVRWVECWLGVDLLLRLVVLAKCWRLVLLLLVIGSCWS